MSWAGGPITFNKTKAVLPPPAVNILPPPHTSEMPSGGYTSVSGALQQLRGASGGGGMSQCGRPKQFVRGGRRWGWVYGISLLWGVRGVGLGAMWEACTSSIPHIPQGWCFMRGGLYTLQLGIGARQKESSERGVSRVLLWGTFFVVFVIYILTESV